MTENSQSKYAKLFWALSVFFFFENSEWLKKQTDEQELQRIWPKQTHQAYFTFQSKELKKKLKL